MKLHDHGVYLVNGQLTDTAPAHVTEDVYKRQESSLPCMCVRPACRMPQTETGRTKRHTYFI